jgi:hypothetical protein
MLELISAFVVMKEANDLMYVALNKAKKKRVP